MTKRLSAVTGNYTNQQGEQKAEWTNVGALITGKNGKDYVLLDPSINLAGVLLKQNAIAAKEGKAPSDTVMLSVFDEQQNQNNNNYQNNQGGYHQQNNQPQGGYNQNQPQHGGYQNSPQQGGYQQK
jgi:hypothetical protein